MAAVEEAYVETESSPAPRSKKRKRSENSRAKEKAKSKAKKKAKKGSDSDSEYDDEFGMDMYKKSKPMPGQLENCDICNKRFTVTPYSKEGPEGGLLCTPCGKQMAKENKAAETKAKKAAGTGRKRRQVESNRLDGVVRLGGKSLQDLCIEKVAQHHTDVEELGDLPDELVDRLSQIFSKRRVLDSSNLQLFLRPDLDVVAIHDAAKLESDDFKQIFAIAPNVRKLVLRNAGQFKDNAMDYMLEKASNISYFQLYGSNLLTDRAWTSFFKQAGKNLETVKIQWCDASFTEEVLETLVACCPNLKHIKLKYCRKLTPECIRSLASLKKLEYVSLKFSTSPESDHLKDLIDSLGPQLRTLSLENIADVDDTFLDSLRSQCRRLRKLRLEGCECVTDAALTALFTPGDNENDETGSVLPPLAFLDLSSTRDVDHSNPEGPEDTPIGIADSSFKAVMKHSGKSLQHLDISSCRHVSHGAFCDVFSPLENAKKYAELKTINVTFCSGVETNVIKGIFACCPSLQKIIAFGCFKVGDIIVPQDVALIGVPRAQDAIEKIGESGVNLEDAIGMMSQMVEAAA